MTIQLQGHKFDVADSPTVGLWISTLGIKPDETLAEQVQGIDSAVRFLAVVTGRPVEWVRDCGLAETMEAYKQVVQGWTNSAAADPQSAATGDSPTS